MSRIEWTQQTWNPIVGCSVVSPGCTNCYAMRQAARIERMGVAPHYAGMTQPSKAGAVWTGKVALAPDAILLAPLKRRKPTTWFVNSMGDLFHESVPDDWIDRVFAVMALAPQHTFQVLTKRAARMRAYFASRALLDERGQPAEDVRIAMTVWASMPSRRDMAPALKAIPLGKFCAAVVWPLPNVWLGVSAEDQRRADERVPDLLATPAAVRFVSAEPLLGPIDFMRWLAIDWQCSYCRGFFTGRHRNVCPDCGAEGGWTGSHSFNGRGQPKRPGFPVDRGRGLDWIIVGGESGPNARPMHPDWARSIRDQCAAAAVPFFFKQWGEWAPGSTRDRQPGWEPGQIYPATTVFGDAAYIAAEDAEWSPLLERFGKRAAGRRLDGALHDAMPEARR